MNEKLKPCPFCGGNPYLHKNGRLNFEYWEVVCDTVCDFTGPADNTEAGAIKAWNRRTPNPAVNVGPVMKSDWTDEDRARAWRDAFDAMHQRAMKAEASLSALTSPQGEETPALQPDRDIDHVATMIWSKLGFMNDRLNQIPVLANELRKLLGPSLPPAPTLKAPDRDGGGE